MSSAVTDPPPQTLAECLQSAGGGGDGGGGDGGGDPGAAAAEVAAWLVERVLNFSIPLPQSSSSSASLASLLDEVASSLRSGGRNAQVLDAGVFDWAPKVLGAADGEAAEKKKVDVTVDGDRDRAPSTSSLSSLSSPVAAAVHRLASALAAHLSPREALALFSAEMSSTRGQGSLSPKQAALLSALPLALSRLGRTTARIPSATGALSAATSAAVRALTSAGAAAATAAAAERGMGSSSSSTLSFISACQSAEEFASALPAVAEAWRTGGAAERGSARGEGEAGEYARSLLASSLLRLLPAACLPFAPLRPPSPSAVELLKPQTVSALGRGEERALGSSERKRASGAAGGVAVAIVSALCSLSTPSSGDGSEPAPPPSFGNSWGFSVETSALPPKKKKEEKKKKKGVGSDDGGNDSDSGDEDSDKEEEEEEEEGGGEEQEAAAVGRTPSALSLALATYASAWCSFERSDESGATGKRGGLSLSLSAASASAAVAASTTSSRSLSAAAASVPALLEAAFARRSPGLVVAAAQLASVSASATEATAAAAAAAAGATAAEGAASEAAAPSAAPPRPSCEAAGRLLPHLSRAMSFTPSSAARNACYEAWEATLRAMPAAERAAECARLADEAAAAPPPPSPSGRPSAPAPSPPSRPPPNAALEALALHHLSSMVASSWPTPPPSSRAAAGGERGEPGGGGPAPAAAATAAALLASAATARVFPLGPRPLGWGGSEVSLLERVEPVAASLAALRLLLLRGRAAAPLPPSLASGLPAPLAALVSDGEAQRRWRRRTLVSEALLPLRAAACSAAQGLRAAAGEAGKECAGGGSEAGLAVERLLDALARVLELAEA